jgi:hypothetical protein
VPVKGLLSVICVALSIVDTTVPAGKVTVPAPLRDVIAEPEIILARLDKLVTTAEPAVTVAVGDTGDTFPRSILLLATARSFELTVVVVPVTTKLPAITVSFNVPGISSAVNLRKAVSPDAPEGDAKK